MFCISCGSQIRDDALFCPKCGHKTVTDAPEKDSADNFEGNLAAETDNRTQKKGNKKRPVLIIIIAFIAVIVAVAAVYVFYKETDYVRFVREWEPYTNTQDVLHYSVGEVFDACFPSAEWKKEKINGKNYVTIHDTIKDSAGSDLDMVYKIKIEHYLERVTMNPDSLVVKYKDESMPFATEYEGMDAISLMEAAFTAYDLKMDVVLIPTIANWILDGAYDRKMTHCSIPEIGVEFDYPEGWDLDDEIANGYITDPSLHQSNVHMQLSVGTAEDINGVLTESDDTIKANFAQRGSHVIEIGRKSLGDVIAKYVKYKYQVNDHYNINLDYYYKTNQGTYIISFLWTENITDLYVPVFTDIINSFSVTVSTDKKNTEGNKNNKNNTNSTSNVEDTGDDTPYWIYDGSINGTYKNLSWGSSMEFYTSNRMVSYDEPVASFSLVDEIDYFRELYFYETSDQLWNATYDASFIAYPGEGFRYSDMMIFGFYRDEYNNIMVDEHVYDENGNYLYSITYQKE